MLIYKVLYNMMVYFQLFLFTLDGQVGTFENYQEACQTNLYSETSIRKHSRFQLFPFFFPAPKSCFKPIALVSCLIILLRTVYLGPCCMWSTVCLPIFINQCFSMQKSKEELCTYEHFVLWLLHVTVYISASTSQLHSCDSAYFYPNINSMFLQQISNLRDKAIRMFGFSSILM